MKSLLKNSILGALSVCLMAACNERTLYHSYLPLPDNGWKKSDTLFFQVPVAEATLSSSHLFVEVRNKSNYKYQNLYLFISNNFKGNSIWSTDTIRFSLADQEGKWKGIGWGSLFQSTSPASSVPPVKPGNYIIKVSHGMKDELLPGINDIGIRIEK